MSEPHVSHHRRTFSASHAVEVAGEVLRQIKDVDNLTYAELGRVLGKGEDQAERIAKGNSVMDMPTFLAACEYWGERFADKLMALAGLRTTSSQTEAMRREPGSMALARLLPAILEAEADGVEEAEELAPHEDLIRQVNQKTGQWLNIIAGDASARAAE